MLSSGFFNKPISGNEKSMVANSKTYPKYIGSEESLQKSLALYLDYSGLLWFHPPNEIKAKPQYMAKRKTLGVKSGVPDVCILEPRGNYHGLFIELKVGYNKPSDSQKKWIAELNQRGYAAYCCNSLDEAIEIIEKYKTLNK